MVEAPARVATAPASLATQWRRTIHVPKPVVGPGTYSPRRKLTTHKPPSFGFGTASRFGTKSRFISNGHQSELLCTAGPGPKYRHKSHPDKNQAPLWSMGPSPAMRMNKAKTADAAMFSVMDGDLGPAAYTPRNHLTKKTANRTKFGKSPRFHTKHPFVNDSFALREYGIHKLKPSPDMYSPRDTIASPRVQVHAFGPGVSSDSHIPYPPSSRPDIGTPAATKQCNIGPGDYQPDAISSSHAPPNFGFSKSKRFPKNDPQFQSKQHCLTTNLGLNSPGPKYNDHHGEVSFLPQRPRGGNLQFLP